MRDRAHCTIHVEEEEEKNRLKLTGISSIVNCITDRRESMEVDKTVKVLQSICRRTCTPINTLLNKCIETCTTTDNRRTSIVCIATSILCLCKTLYFLKSAITRMK